MISPDLFVNLIAAPITFLLLVVIRERLRRAFLPRLPRNDSRKGVRATGRHVFLLSKRENI